MTDALGPGVDWDSLGYIAVDQLEDGIVGLVISRWFGIDELGRLHFGEESDSSRIATLATALHRLTRRT